VAFSSYATNVDPGDTDYLRDMYVKNLATGDITLASTSDGGTKGIGGDSLVPSLSADGTRVAFHSGANNLDPGDTDYLRDIYVKEPAAGTPGGQWILQRLKAKVKGNKAIITGQIAPPAPGEKVSLTFFANGSALKKVAKKSAELNADSRFKRKFKVPAESTRCKVKVAFKGDNLGKKKFKC
jgi:hypothetical protein